MSIERYREQMIGTLESVVKLGGPHAAHAAAELAALKGASVGSAEGKPTLVHTIEVQAGLKFRCTACGAVTTKAPRDVARTDLCGACGRRGTLVLADDPASVPATSSAPPPGSASFTV